MEKRTVLLSFLGKAKYGERRYSFPGEFSCDDTLPVAAVWTFLRDFRRKRITDFIIAGTAGSSWGNLKAWFNSSLKLGLPYEVQNCPDEITPEQLREEEDLLNREIGERCGVQFRLVLHERYSCSLDEQFSVVRGVRDLVPEGADLFIDVTTGLRVIPMVAHALALCLKETRKVKIREVFYDRDSSNNNKRDTTGRVETVNDWINRINGLAASEDTALARQKLNALRELLDNAGDPKKAAGGSQNTDTKKLPPNNVCILNPLSEYVRTADIVNRFMHSGDIGVFRDLESADDFRSEIEDAGQILKYCDYEKARNVIPVIKKIIASVRDQALQECLKDSSNLGWMLRKVSNDAAFFRGLSAMYANQKNFLYAMIACYQALECEYKTHCNNETNGQEQQCSNKTKKYRFFKYRYKYKYGQSNSPYEDFINVFRSALIHKSNKATKDCCERELFYHDLDDCLYTLGVNINPFRSKTPETKMMLSFLGAGDYTRTDYEYYDPFTGESDSRYTLSNSLFLGVSMARRLRDEKGLDKLLVIGSNSSSWNVFLKSFLEQFAFSDNVREELEKALAILSSIEGDFSPNDMQALSDILKTASQDIGMDVEMLVISPEIENQEEQQKLCREINERTKFNTRLYIDLTHSYRIMPVLMFGVLAYMKSFKGITVEKIFYGDFQPNNSTADVSDLIRKLNNLKHDPASYDLLKPEVAHLISDVTPVCAKSYVYDMKNLDLLIDYSMALGNYVQSGKISFLLPLINSEFQYGQGASKADNRQKMVTMFKSGTHLLGLSMFYEARSKLLPVYQELCRKIHNPVLELLGNEIKKYLSWLEDYQNSNIDAMCSMSEVMLRNGNDLESLLYSYQALQELDSLAYNGIKDVYLHNQCQRSVAFSELDAFLSQQDKINSDKHANAAFYDLLCKGEYLKNCKPESRYTSFCSALNLFIFEENWRSIQKTRKTVLHSEKKKKCEKKLSKNDIERARKSVEMVISFLKSHLPSKKDMKPKNVCQTLLSLKGAYAGWKDDAGDAQDIEQKTGEGDVRGGAEDPQART